MDLLGELVYVRVLSVKVFAVPTAGHLEVQVSQPREFAVKGEKILMPGALAGKGGGLGAVGFD